MNRNPGRALFMALACGVFLWGCGEQAFPKLATPSLTMENYLRSSSKLRSEVQLQEYLLSLGCFSQADREWFDKHYDSLPYNHDDETYKMLNLAQKKAYAFGEVVVKAGPATDNPVIYVRSQTENTALVQIDGVPGEYRLVKEGPNWRIVGLFGVNKGQ